MCKVNVTDIFNKEELNDTNLNIYDAILVSKNMNFPDKFKNNTDVGLDLYSQEDIIFSGKSKQAIIVSTGLKTACKPGFHFEVRPRSSLFLKTGLMLVNSPGTIDPNYRGEIGMILCKIDDEYIKINKGTKLCQLCLIPYIPLNSENYIDITHKGIEILRIANEEIFDNWDKVFPSDRGTGGFGSTGGYI